MLMSLSSVRGPVRFSPALESDLKSGRGAPPPIATDDRPDRFPVMTPVDVSSLSSDIHTTGSARSMSITGVATPPDTGMRHIFVDVMKPRYFPSGEKNGVPPPS